MKLRIIAGSFKGRMITIPQKDTDFRPTGDRIREAVASMLSPLILNAQVADICAGSGALGFEMASRGAKKITFVEFDRYRCRQLRLHAEKFDILNQCTISEKSVTAFLTGCRDQFDIIYYDPPYDAVDLSLHIPSIIKLLSPKGVLIYERRARSRKHPTQPIISDNLVDNRIYGETELCIFKHS